MVSYDCHSERVGQESVYRCERSPDACTRLVPEMELCSADMPRDVQAVVAAETIRRLRPHPLAARSVPEKEARDSTARGRVRSERTVSASSEDMLSHRDM